MVIKIETSYSILVQYKEAAISMDLVSVVSLICRVPKTLSGGSFELNRGCACPPDNSVGLRMMITSIYQLVFSTIVTLKGIMRLRKATAHNVTFSSSRIIPFKGIKMS